MEAISRDPDDAEKRRWLAARWKEAGRLDLARALWRSVVERGEATDEDLFQVGYLSQRLGDGTGAVDAYLALLERSPHHPQANYNFSQMLASAGDTAGAVRHLERAVIGSPTLQAAYIDLALIYLEGGHNEEARRTLLDFLSRAVPDSLIASQVRSVLRTLAEESSKP
jgi:tetratricopeptide (TPR) repeat protein